MSITAAGSQNAASVTAPYLRLEIRVWVRIRVRVLVRVCVRDRARLESGVRVRASIRVIELEGRAIPERRLHAKHLHLQSRHLCREIGYLRLEIGHLSRKIGPLRLWTCCRGRLGVARRRRESECGLKLRGC